MVRFVKARIPRAFDNPPDSDPIVSTLTSCCPPRRPGRYQRLRAAPAIELGRLRLIPNTTAQLISMYFFFPDVAFIMAVSG